MASSAIRSGYNHRRFTRDEAGGMLLKRRGRRDFSTISAYSYSGIRRSIDSLKCNGYIYCLRIY